jgi:predicted peptidase
MPPFTLNRSACCLTICTALLLNALWLAGCGMVPEKPVVDDESGEPAEVPLTELFKLVPGDYKQTWHTQDGRMISFSISVPAMYSDEQATPLIVALHHGPDRMTQFFGNELLQGMIKPATEDLPAIIIAPDVINQSWQNFRCEECIMALLREVCETYNVDRQRVLLVGYSMGAEGVWHYAGRHPDFFTAAIPIAGHPPSDYLSTNWSVPMLVIHSRSDEVFPFKQVADAVNSLEARGNSPVQLYALEGISHYESGRFIEPLEQAVAWVQQVWKANAADAVPGGDGQTP